MEVEDKLSELNMTADEIDKLTKAFKDERFREMLRDYAQEISDPENKKKYEEEIRLLEQERGNNIEFIHPKPFRALKTSVNGKQKCFINICGNEKAGKPEYKCGVSEDGRRGQCWSLPHSLHPGRQDRDPKGNKIMIYDVIFHPDTLHIASKNKKFMDMVDNTAIQGIQNAFNVNLDENNVREMKTKYKGTPQPCVIRKPIPGYKAKEPSEKPDPLDFPYPDEKRPTTSSQIKPTESTATKSSSDSNPKSFQIQPQKTKEPTKPNYTIKYRSVIDLQDFRCSRDSAKSPRPKEIVVTIDLPLVKSATDASLEAKERTLLLETKKPAYRLELPLAYPVDEDKGEAKFNKHTGQLTVTLPVLPSDKAFDFAIGPANTVSDVQRVNDGERQEKSGELEEDIGKEKEKEGNKSDEEKVKEERKVEAEDLRQQTRVEKDNNETVRKEKGRGQMRNALEIVEGRGHEVGEKENLRKQNKKGQECVEEEREVEEQKSDKIYESESEEEEKVKKQEREDGERVGKCNLQKRQDKHHDKKFSKHNLWGDGCDRVAEKKDSVLTGFQPDVDSDKHTGLAVKQETEVDCTGEEKVHLDSCLELTPKIKSSDIQRETENIEEILDSTLKVRKILTIELKRR